MTSGIKGPCNRACKPGHKHEMDCQNYFEPEDFAQRLARQSDDAAEAKWGVRPNGTVRTSPKSGESER